VRRLLLLVVAALLAPPCFAHGTVDLAVHISAPEYVAAGSTASFDVIVDVLGFDPADDVTLRIDVADARVAAADAEWDCAAETGAIVCTAEALSAGSHPVRVEAKVPSSKSTVTLHATVEALGNLDPQSRNDAASEKSAVYDPALCVQPAPRITGDFAWTTVSGAAGYQVFFAVDGEALHLLTATSSTSLAVRVPGGNITWFVRARFNGCPSRDSGQASFQSTSAPSTIALTPAAALVSPHSVGITDDVLIIGDAATHKLYTLDSDLHPLILGGDVVSDPPAFDGGIAGAPGGFLFVADRSTHTIRLVDSTQALFTIGGQPDSAGTVDARGLNARFDAPAGIAVNESGVLFITDAASHVIRTMTWNDEVVDFDVVTIAGAAGQPGYADGSGSAARFNDPEGVAVDASGNLIVADRGNHVLRLVTPSGEVSTLAGTAGRAGHVDGNVANALFDRPVGVAIDPFGNLYATEEGNRDVRKIAPNGRVTTVATALARPRFPAVAADGTVWIPDANGSLLRGTPASGDRRRAVKR
jgi:NHL repeat-containing protein